MEIVRKQAARTPEFSGAQPAEPQQATIPRVKKMAHFTMVVFPARHLHEATLLLAKQHR
jgi:hypothetical protein